MLREIAEAVPGFPDRPDRRVECPAQEMTVRNVIEPHLKETLKGITHVVIS